MDGVGSRVRIARKARGWTSYRLAQEAEIRAETVSRIENGHLLPGSTTLVALSNALRVTTDWLLKGEGDGPPAVAADDAAA